MKRLLIFIILIFFVVQAKATHQRAAEITYVHKGGNTYAFTVTMFTRTSSPADDQRDYMPIKWGDGTEEDIKRIIFQDIGNDITYNVYQGTHTFPGTGSYIISVEDPNRNNGVVNIPNSVNVPMYIESLLVIDPFLGPNNSVQLTNPPIDVGCVNKLFEHNPATYDPDGDDLVYKLVVCKGQNGMDIPGYTFPKASEYFKIDSQTGEIIWKNPILQGEYNIAFVVEEWRSGVKVGAVRRDMQINIVACNHNPPVFDPVPDTCVMANDFLTFPVTASDPEDGTIALTAKGGPFSVQESPAEIEPDPAVDTGSVTTDFMWQTTCSHIRKNPFQAVFKAKDNGTPVNLVTFQSVNISVISPPPENLTATPLGRSITLNWNTAECPNAIGYKVYRKDYKDDWSPAFCETGVPPYTRFKLIKTISGRQNTEFTDDNNGTGLKQGILYCYRVTATFYGGAESKASDTACTFLKRDAPIITNVTNDSLNLEAGKAWVIWSKPTELDTLQYPGPYEYHVFRNNGLNWNNEEEIAVLNGLKDTTFFDDKVNLNTNDQPYSYRIDLHYKEGYLNSSDDASSVFISLHPFDKRLRLNITTKVPWINTEFVIYRKSPGSSSFVILDTAYSNTYDDYGLENFQEYCYYVKAIGHYTLTGIIDPLVNFSQITCGIPQDKEPPCKPLLWVDTDCDNIENKLTWSVPYDSCNYDVEKYVIYHSKPTGSLHPIDSVFDATDTTYVHDNIDKVVGCYGVVAVDSVGNRSEMSDLVCVNYDACPPCKLPNVFTPNNDGFNDELTPLTNLDATIKQVEITIFNRWGQEVYYFIGSEMANFKWDGTDLNTGKLLPDGTYFYKCKYVEWTFDGNPVTGESQGSITIITGKVNK
jgi:gliding motility-associated-like protein